MLQMSKKLQERMLEKRQDEWLQDQVHIAREAFPEITKDVDDEQLAERLEKLFASAAEQGIGHDANHQRFAHIALGVDNDDFYVNEEWAATIFAWDVDENMKLSACEQFLANQEQQS